MGEAEPREVTQLRMRELCAQGDYDAAATLAISTYGRELTGFLMARLGEQAGTEAFSDFLEDFWRGLPGFGWRSTLRTWAYMLARHAAARHARGARRRRDCQHTLSSGLSGVAEQVRTETAAHLRTELKDRVRVLREQLTDEEQSLLIRASTASCPFASSRW